MKYLLIYVLAISLFAVILTVHDKHAAQRRMMRVSERKLIVVAAAGGSAAMLITMRVIRHKTQHAKFMVGLPVILILQAAVVYGVFRWLMVDRL